MLVGVSSHVMAGKLCVMRCDVAIRQTEASSYYTEVNFTMSFVYVCVCIFVCGTITY